MNMEMEQGNDTTHRAQLYFTTIQVDDLLKICMWLIVSCMSLASVLYMASPVLQTTALQQINLNFQGPTVRATKERVTIDKLT